jgi:NAD(P)H-nitrite reductase large subunit
MANLKNQKEWDPNWDDKWCTPEDLNSPDDDVVCTCWNVTVGDIKQKINEGCSHEDIVNLTGLGTSCQLCINRFVYLFEEFSKKK